MKNLLSINSYHYLRGGVETVYFNHAQLFATHGWSTSFFSMHHPENFACEDSEYFADCIDYANQGDRSFTNAFKIIYSSEARKKLARMLDRKPPTVAHVHSIYHHLSPSVLMELKRRAIPTVMTAHDLKLVCPNNKMLNSTGICERCRGGKLWNAAIHRCIKDSLPASGLVVLESAIHQGFDLYGRNLDRIILPSRFYFEKLVEWGWDPAKLIYIPNAIAIPKQSPSAPGGYILYFGRLAHEKGLETLIKAAAASHAPVKLAGTGPEDGKLRALAETTGAPVEFLGFQAGEALWSLVDNARAVVLPSEWYENSPMSILEAFARGKPLIGARIGGLTELIVEDQTGWSFESGNVEALAQQLAKVMAMPDAAVGAVGVAVRRFVAEHHSDERYYDRMRALYKDIGAN